MFDRKSSELFCDALDHSVTVHIPTCLIPNGTTDVEVVDEDNIRDETLLDGKFFEKRFKVTRMCRCSRVLFDEQFTFGFLSNRLDLIEEGVLGYTLNVVQRDVQQVGVKSLGDSFLCHLHCDVENIMSGLQHITC